MQSNLIFCATTLRRRLFFALALILFTSSAASLESESIGTFFSLPNWLPRSVTSHDTPGSDPEDGSGWYIDEYTNGVAYTDWVVKDEQGRDAQDVQKPYYDDRRKGWWIYELAFNDDRISDYAFHEIPRTEPNFVPDEGKSIMDISWQCTVMCYETEEDAIHGINQFTLSFRFTAHRDLITTPVPSGRRVPRASRLPPAIQAAVNSTFEAYYERKYFSSQGQSNVWNVAQYGPRTYGPTFDFAKGYDPHGLMFSYSPSNRAVTTRRLVEYDNLEHLADAMLADYYENRLGYLVDRPGWLNRNMFWSTTGVWGSEVSDSLLPDFGDGVHNPTYPYRSQWSTRMPVLSDLNDDNTVWTGYASGYMRPGVILMRDMSFGQSSGWDDYVPEWCHWSSSGSLTMGGLIETNYPSANGLAIAKVTHRLISDRLCCVNQALGLMDRTYHLPTVVYPTVGTNTTYHNEVRYSGDTTCEISFDDDKQEYEAKFGDDISWDGGVSTNWSDHESLPATGTAIARRFSGSATSVGTAIKLNDATPADADVDDNWVIERLLRISGDLSFPNVRSNGFVTVDIIPDGVRYGDGWMGVDMPVNLYGDDGQWYDYYNGYDIVDVSVTGVTATVFFNYHRNYSYARMLGSLRLLVSQPGRDALLTRRVVGSRAGAVLGTHSRRDGAWYDLTPIRWNRETSMPLYRSTERDYTERFELEYFLAGLETEAELAFNGELGAVPTSWRDIIPIRDDSVNTRNSVTLDNVGIQLVENVDIIRVWVSIDDVEQGRIVSGHVMYAITTLTDETEFYGYVPLYRYQCTDDPHHDTPRVSERAPLSTDAKIGIVTRTDWDWQTLRRTDD